MTVNQRIRICLVLKNLSYESLADELEITKAAVSNRINRGKEIEDPEFIEAVSKVTECPVEALKSDKEFKKFLFPNEDDLEIQLESLSGHVKYLEEKERQNVSTIKYWMGRASEKDKENVTLQIEKHAALEELAKLKESLS